MKHSLIKKLKNCGGMIIKPNPVVSNLLKFNIPKAINRYHQKVKLIDNDILVQLIVIMIMEELNMEILIILI